MSDTPETTPVVIVGGGPVGLTLGLELAWHGIASTIIEPRTEVDHSRPRAKTVNVRSMEHYRRLGVAEIIRDRAPVSRFWSRRAIFCTAVNGTELATFEGIFNISPEREDLFSEGGQALAQPLLEQILREQVQAEPLVAFIVGGTATSVDERPDGVDVTYSLNDVEHQISATYAVGADGPGGVTRRGAGIGLERGVDLPPNVSVTFRTKGGEPLPTTLDFALHYWVVNAQTQGVLMRLDEHGTWSATVGNVPDADTADPLELIERLTGYPVDVEILAKDAWAARMAVADSYGTDRIFLVGDAAHLNPPWGGHGFNTGLGDAVNLGWNLAATLQGWGGPALLASYEPERRPVAEHTVEVATANMRAIPPSVVETLRDDPLLVGPEAAATRAIVQEAKDSEFHSLGLVLGFSYDGSPIVWTGPADGDDGAPEFDAARYTPTTHPGARLPHQWLPDGRSVYDLITDGFTLFADPDSAVAQRFVGAAAERQVPLTVGVPLGGEPLLVRSDGHIAWRGVRDDSAAVDAGAVLNHARGGGR